MLIIPPLLGEGDREVVEGVSSAQVVDKIPLKHLWEARDLELAPTYRCALAPAFHFADPAAGGADIGLG